ncbi:helix-turn-helix domain-containing protein [Christensenellaceae bacterium OttesenSCG-928-M15]|nr:helix-turn-helix domain-containing protein [Christensenellaceae bacterium OttesenSCG-928-M15]
MEVLKLLRENEEMSHGTMARLLKISKSYYWQLENNQRRLYYDLALRIAKIFDMKPDEIFYEETSANLSIKFK